MTEQRHMDPALAKALVDAQRIVSPAEKTSENTFHRYRYASSETIIEVAGVALEKCGLAMVPISLIVELLAAGVEKVAGGAVAMLHATYALIHQSGASWSFVTDVPIIPELGKSSGWSRPLDKALFAARTEALSYALRDALLIPREDAPDVSGRRDRGRREEGGDGNGLPPRDDFPRLTVDDACARFEKADKMTDVAQTLQLARAWMAQQPVAPSDVALEKVECSFTAAAVRILDGYKSKAQAVKAEALIGRVTEGRKLREDNRRAIDEALARAKECP